VILRRRRAVERARGVARPPRALRSRPLATCPRCGPRCDRTARPAGPARPPPDGVSRPGIKPLAGGRGLQAVALSPSVKPTSRRSKPSRRGLGGSSSSAGAGPFGRGPLGRAREVAGSGGPVAESGPFHDGVAPSVGAGGERVTHSRAAGAGERSSRSSGGAAGRDPGRVGPAGPSDPRGSGGPAGSGGPVGPGGPAGSGGPVGPGRGPGACGARVRRSSSARRRARAASCSTRRACSTAGSWTPEPPGSVGAARRSARTPLTPTAPRSRLRDRTRCELRSGGS